MKYAAILAITGAVFSANLDSNDGGTNIYPCYILASRQIAVFVILLDHGDVQRWELYSTAFRCRFLCPTTTLSNIIPRGLPHAAYLPFSHEDCRIGRLDATGMADTFDDW